MNNQTAHTIRIHPPGTRITDATKASILAAAAPTAFRKAQDLLAATEKYVKKDGFFTSDRTRIQRVQAECYALVRALKQDGCMSQEMTAQGEAYAVVEFLSEFSDAFPNWQPEYEALNRLIRAIYS